ncbi:hypothetical protein BT96DRAFT_821548, partial [Gymnopus androsaceus JB14]
ERFPRESSSSLYNLLTYKDPEETILTETGKLAQPKDRSATFYRAQIIHYGIQDYKTKGAAKRHLLRAFDANHQLKVPENILLIERELKAEYDEVKAEVESVIEESRQEIRIENERKQQVKSSRKNMDTLGGNDIGAMAKRLSDTALKNAIKIMPEGDLRKIVGKVVKNLPELRDAIEMHVSKSERPATKSNKGKSKATKVCFSQSISTILNSLSSTYSRARI